MHELPILIVWQTTPHQKYRCPPYEMYGDLKPEHKEHPKVKAQRISRGLRLFITVDPYSSQNTDITVFSSL